MSIEQSEVIFEEQETLKETAGRDEVVFERSETFKNPVDCLDRGRRNLKTGSRLNGP